jgi:hypothetical protein
LKAKTEQRDESINNEGETLSIGNDSIISKTLKKKKEEIDFKLEKETSIE